MSDERDGAGFPQASGQRAAWSEVPAQVRGAIEQRLGAPVVQAIGQVGGFSPGVAARLRLGDGSRAFVKLVSPTQNADTPEIFRREAAIARELPDGLPVPRLLFDLELDGWVALCFDEVDGSLPTLPWQPRELELVLAAVDRLGEQLTPSPIAAPLIEEQLAGTFCGFRSLVEERDTAGELDGVDPWIAGRLDELAAIERTWADGTHGETLLHCDLRADNILVGPGAVTFVDWPHAAIGARWFDVACMLPSVAMQGGPDPWELFDRQLAARDADPCAVDAVICALTGYFAAGARQPSPPGLPTLRGFQRAQGAAALRWLRRRLD